MHIMISSTQVDALEVPKPNNKHPPRMGDDATTAIPKIKTRTMLSRGGLLPMRPLVSVGIMLVAWLCCLQEHLRI